MRFLGLTLCLLASSFTARAESVEERIGALESRVKALEEALRNQPASPIAAIADGSYKGRMPSGESVTIELAKGRIFVSSEKESRVGTYEVIGNKVVMSFNGKSEFLRIEGDHLKNEQIDLIKSK